VSAPIPAPIEWPDCTEETLWRRTWAATMLAGSVEIFFSIVNGRPVLARQLDAVALRRALRGRPLPPAGHYVTVSAAMLDAVNEGGPLTPRSARS
jgi:hypothetical protein